MGRENLIQNSNELFTDSEALLAMVAHDLKNPITAITLAIKSFDDAKISPLNDFQEEILTGIMSSLHYMQTLIINLLDRYRFNGGNIELQKTSVNFSDFLATVLDASKYIFLEKHQTIKIVNKLKNPTIEIDVLGIRQVINNLISNAYKYAPETSTITVKLFEDNNNLLFSVENEGFIENSADIFDKFAGNKNKNIFSTGLGLYIVKEIVNRHNGNITVNCNSNSICITVSLPKQ